MYDNSLNVWGKGGLFEQALSSKMGLQGAQGETMRQNADTQRMNVENQYDLGLRNNAVNQFGADTNRMNVNNQFTLGQQQNDTARFGAETGRVTAMNTQWQTGNPTKRTINELGLRSFAPSTTPAPGMLPNKDQKIGVLGMNRGGMVLKPKMVKQPGYMHGGKIKMPNGYKMGGKIGDVQKDTGADTVDVKAREGEYFLNPETVAHIGGGDYSKGVRSLDSLVREATGKEPGPVPVGKGGKPGFGGSGALVPIEGTGRTGYVPNWTVPSPTPPAPSTAVAVRNAPNWTYYQAPPAAPAPVAPPAAPAAPNKAYEMGKQLGQKAGPTLRNAASFTRAAAPNALIAAPLAGFGDYEIDDPEAETSTIASLRKGAVEAGLDSLSGIAKTVDFATGLVGGNMDLAGRLRRKVESDLGPMLKNNKSAPAVDAKTLDDRPAPGGGETVIRQQVDEPKKPSLRDMMMARYSKLNNELSQLDSEDQGGRAARLIQMAGMQKDLADMEEKEIAGSRSLAAAALKSREDADKRISERFQIPKYDKEGRVVGFEKDPNAANGLRDFVAQMQTPDGRPVDFYALSPEMQDKILNAYDINSRGTRRLNQRVMEEGGAKGQTSMMPRIGGNSLRLDGEMTIGDIGDPNISFGDWLTSWGPNKMEKMVLRDPVTGQRVAARHVLMREDGTIDQDLVEQMNRAAEAGVRRK